MKLRPSAFVLPCLLLPALLLAGQRMQLPGAVAPRILVLLAKGFNRQEFYDSWNILAAQGFQIEVASFQKGTVLLNVNNKPTPGLDAEAALNLKEVKPENYSGLFVPGGYSPGFLEQDHNALQIVRAFAKARKPMGFICHGPRLLLRTGLLRQRVFTCLFSVADEMADFWRERPFRAYLDLPVVVDGNLITARYPGDSKLFADAFGRLLSGKDAPASTVAKLPDADVFRMAVPKTPDAVVAMSEGFDERAAAEAISTLNAAGRIHILLCGPTPGKLKSANGIEVDAVAAFPETLPPNMVVVAPGFFWPQKGTEVRQASQPAWVDDQEIAVAAREAWLLRQREAGATLVLVGLDALRTGRLPDFKGAKFATIEPAMWSFPKGGGTYTHDPFFHTADRLFTVCGPDAVKGAISAALDSIKKPKP